MTTLRMLLAQTRHEADCATAKPPILSHREPGIAERYLSGATHPNHLARIEYLCGVVRLLGRELESLSGINVEPHDAESRIDVMDMGATKVRVEWSFTVAEPGNGIEGGPVIESVYLNGAWVDPVDCISESQMQAWADEASRILARERDAFAAEQVAA